MSRAGAITTLIDRPLGVSGVTNPLGATGGQDPQSVDDIRTNAPLSVLTLGRAVSITDYQNFAATFAGIAKAYAIWIPSGPGAEFSHRRGRGRLGAAAGQSHAGQPGRRAAGLRQSAHSDHRRLVSGDAFQLQRRPRIRPGL